MAATVTAAAAPLAADRLPRLLPRPGQPPTDLTAHLTAFGAPPYRGRPRLLIPAVQAAGLTGRGGAAFPTWRKLAVVADAGRGRPVVVGNGVEGEPASRKDRTLLWFSPHLVLDGLQLAAETVDATRCLLGVPRDPRLWRRLTAAVDERSRAGIDHVPVRLVAVPPRFLAGEESALVALLDGGPALPRFTPPRVCERGVNGAPTLVQNVETLAHLALVARYGPAWFRAVGTPAEPGSALVTCHRADGAVEVVEAAKGTPLASLLRLGDPPVEAVLVGGYHGAWLTGADAAVLRLADAELRPCGAALGAGVLAALPGDRCGLIESARIARYLAAESAGQCGPCLNGLPRIAAALTALAEPGSHPGAVADLQRWSRLVPGRGACHHPDGSVRFVRSTLTVFADELTRHAQGRCRGTVTRPFLPASEKIPDRPDDWT